LNGSINPDGFATSARFDYGTSTSYGHSTSPVAAGSGSSPVAASAPITGLSAGTTYHYRIVALSNGMPSAFGSDHTLTTSPPAHPTATTGAATNVGVSSATVKGSIKPNGSPTSSRFDYGTSTSYGHSTSRVAAGSGSSPVTASAAITRLSAGITYHYRIVALRNGVPVAFGSDHTFLTKPASTGSGNPPPRVTPPPPQPPPPPLTLTSLRMSPRTFAAARSGPSVVRHRKSGALVTFRLDADATVTFTVQRVRAGRKVKDRCAPMTPANRQAKRCTRSRAIRGSFVIAGILGRQAFRFMGRIRGHALAPGRYRLVARVATPDGDGTKATRFAIRRS
jgi:hypothetical protein